MFGSSRAGACGLQCAALAGLGIALLPTLMVSPHLREGRLREVLPGHGPAAFGVYLVYLSRRQLPRAVQVFTEFVVATMLEAGMVSLDSPPAWRGSAGRQS